MAKTWIWWCFFFFSKNFPWSNANNVPIETVVEGKYFVLHRIRHCVRSVLLFISQPDDNSKDRELVYSAPMLSFAPFFILSLFCFSWSYFVCCQLRCTCSSSMEEQQLLSFYLFIVDVDSRNKDVSTFGGIKFFQNKKNRTLNLHYAHDELHW